MRVGLEVKCMGVWVLLKPHDPLVAVSERTVSVCDWGALVGGRLGPAQRILRKSQVRAEQSVIKIKRRPARYWWKCFVAQSMAIYSRSVGPRRASCLENLWLAKAMTNSLFCLRCVRTAPTPVELASVCRVKAYPQSGNAKTFGEVRACLSCTNARS